MKLSSPRTWLVITAGVLLLAEGVVLYIIRNPPLPPGWSIYHFNRFQLAIPQHHKDVKTSETGHINKSWIVTDTSTHFSLAP